MSPDQNCSRRCAFLGYERIRQDGEFHVTVPEHHPIKIGTFKSILKLIAAHHGLTVDELLEKLDL